MEAPELEIGRSGSGLSLSLEAVQWRGSSRFRAYTQLTFISEKYVDHPHPLALSLATLLPATAQLLVAQPCLEAPAKEDIARQHLGLLSTSQQGSTRFLMHLDSIRCSIFFKRSIITVFL